MTRLIQFANNAVSRLAANVTSSGTSLSLTPGDGAKFPALSGTQFFMGTLVKADGTTEVVKVTARATDTLTIVRAAEAVAGASTASAFSAGDRFEARLTSGGLGNELDRIDAAASITALNRSANTTLTAADVTSLVRVTTTSANITVTLPQISTLADDYDVIVAKVTGDANTVSIVRAGTDLINGATSATLFNQWQSAWLIADRSTNTWTVISSGITAVNTVADAGVGTGSATITLSGNPGSKNNTALFIGGVYQQKTTYSISGTTLTAGGVIASGVPYEVVWSAPLTVGTVSDGAITTAKLADSSVTTAKLADSSVTTAKLATDAVTADKIAAGAVGTSELADAAVTDAKIAAMAATKLTGDVAADRITSALNASGTAPIYACRAWVNFNGTLASGDLRRGNGNVSSITDNGVGDYTVNFTTAMPDANYAVAGVVGDTTQGFSGLVGIGSQANLWVQAAGSLRFQLISNSVKFDATNVNVAIFR